MATSPRNILAKIAKVDGIQDVLVVGRDGFVIEHVGNIDSVATGAIVSTAIGANESMGLDLERGDLQGAMLEYSEGIIIIAPINHEAVLTVTAELDAHLGAVRHAVRRFVPRLEESL